jgi:cleavage and polyadenylation specificity factor subunit 1
MHSDLEKCTHIFLHQDTTCRALEPPYSGSYQVLSQRDNTLQLLMRRRPIIMSADRIKPAYILNGMTAGTTSTHQPQQLQP